MCVRHEESCCFLCHVSHDDQSFPRQFAKWRAEQIVMTGWLRQRSKTKVRYKSGESEWSKEVTAKRCSSKWERSWRNIVICPFAHIGNAAGIGHACLKGLCSDTSSTDVFWSRTSYDTLSVWFVNSKCPVTGVQLGTARGFRGAFGDLQ